MGEGEAVAAGGGQELNASWGSSHQPQPWRLKPQTRQTPMDTLGVRVKTQSPAEPSLPPGSSTPRRCPPTPVSHHPGTGPGAICPAPAAARDPARCLGLGSTGGDTHRHQHPQDSWYC